MKLKAIALALFVAGACASYALADDGHGTGKSDSTSTTSSTSSTTTEGHGKGRDAGTCRPRREFELNGTFVSAAADGSSFQMTVTHGNHHAKALGNPATIGVDAKTRIRKQGQAITLAALTAGDRLNVEGRACKSTGAGPAPPTVVARRVVVKPAKGHDGGHTTTTTTAGTTTTNG